MSSIIIALKIVLFKVTVDDFLQVTGQYTLLLRTVSVHIILMKNIQFQSKAWNLYLVWLYLYVHYFTLPKNLILTQYIHMCTSTRTPIANLLDFS